MNILKTHSIYFKRMNNFAFFTIFIFSSYCFSATTIQSAGKIRKITIVDGNPREYFIHVPASYDGSQAVPMVFMLHGTGGDGEKFADAIGWKDLAEEENFIAVFPSSGRYRIIDEDNEQKITTKWNHLPDASWSLQPGESAMDDIKFLRQVIDEVTGLYTIDAERIYLNGFSNGGAMAAKCSVEMSDVLAAVCQNASSFYIDTVYQPKRKLPVLFQIGNKDYGPGNEGGEIPLQYLDSLLSIPDLPYMNGKHYRIAHRHIDNFNLNESFTISGDTSFAVFATYQPNVPGPGTGYEFRFVMVKGLAHSYPNGENHWFNAPRIHWNWMKQYRLEKENNAKRTLAVEDGYGDGEYDSGKEVHIWSAQQDGKVFTHWTGDTSYLASPFEYHTTLIMPDHDITLTAQYATLTSEMTLSSFMIPGKERNKRVLAYMPAREKVQGIVWFFHGTNGNATNFTNDIEVRQMINLLMVNDYGIIALTSEESEYQIDFDADGNFRWSYSFDSTAIDFANIRAIRDSFIQRGRFDYSTDQIAMGYSAGGAFSEFVANVLNWRAAINHNSPGNEQISLNGHIPYIVSISLNDRHPAVGPEGNAMARANIQNYHNRGICAHLHEYEIQPLFPERFDRSPYINESLSRSIFNEIKSNNLMNEENYLIGVFSELQQIVLNNPSRFPVIISLTGLQLGHLENQIAVTNAEHNIKADINGRTLHFIEKLCGAPSSTNETTGHSTVLQLWPNPVHDRLHIGGSGTWLIFDLTGKEIVRGQHETAEVGSFAPGLYIVQRGSSVARFIKW